MVVIKFIVKYLFNVYIPCQMLKMLYASHSNQNINKIKFISRYEKKKRRKKAAKALFYYPKQKKTTD